MSHRRRQITVVSRTASGFEVREVRSGERLHLQGPAIDLAVDDVYAGVQLDVDGTADASATTSETLRERSSRPDSFLATCGAS